MLKNISNLDGVNVLSKKSQKTVKGGAFTSCSSDADCNSLCGVCLPIGICIFPVNGCA